VRLSAIGWVTQLIMGVVYRMFPKDSVARPRGSPALAWCVLIFLNAGLLLRAVVEPMLALQPLGPWGRSLAGSRPSCNGSPP